MLAKTGQADTFDIQTGKTGPPNVLYIHGVNASVFRKMKKYSHLYPLPP